MSDHNINGQQLKGHLETLVLSMLDDVPMHGYRIMKSLSERSDQVFDLGQGTVYPVLYSMVDKGLLASRQEQTGGRTRRVYRLTARGRRMLVSRKQEWDVFQTAMNRVLRFA